MVKSEVERLKAIARLAQAIKTEFSEPRGQHREICQKVSGGFSIIKSQYKKALIELAQEDVLTRLLECPWVFFRFSNIRIRFETICDEAIDLVMFGNVEASGERVNLVVFQVTNQLLRGE